MPASSVRCTVTLACEDCQGRNYRTSKNRRSNPERLTVRKFCSNCGTSRVHRETR